MKYLAHSIASASYQPGSLFRLRPYKRTHDGTLFYGMIDSRHVDDNKPGSLRSCLVEMSDELREEVNSLKFPGGATVNFYQQQNRDWLVSVKAQNILASTYLRLMEKDMEDLLSEMNA